ncbi:MAG: S-methyl-5-thioribose-1-phosphate isomerase [Nitrososphaerales archaeon]
MDLKLLSFYTARTIRWEDGKVILIDQTKLPNKLTYITCTKPKEVVEAIKRMQIRGAPAIGAAAAYTVALAAYHTKANNLPDLLKEIEEVGKMAKNARPTAANPAWAVERTLSAAKKATSVEEAVKLVVKEAESIAEEDIEACRKIGKYGETLLKDGDTVLTQCNAGALATVGYGTALGVIRAACEKGKCIKVIVPETRPALQGARLTAYELHNDGIDVMLIADTAVGFVMRKKLVDKVVVGADRITNDGHIFNKIGTYQLAVLASEHSIPFYAAAPTSSFDLKSKAEDVVIEERSPDEIVKIKGQRVAPKGVRVYNPVFDQTPPNLISAIITERGIIKPPYERTIKHTLTKL